MDNHDSPLIFLIGVRARSGTNYLGHLLYAHPDCARPKGMGEGRIKENLALLERFVQDVARKPVPGRQRLATELRAGLGAGITSALERSGGSSPFVVIKTPRVQGLERLRHFFADAKVVLLVRDGRAVAESSRRTFGSGATLEFEAKEWAAAARAISAFMERDPGVHTLVRYEDVLEDPELELRRVFQDLGLDPDGYDYDEARAAPVRGSSTYHGEGEARTHWKPLPTDSSFRPQDRARGWSVGRRRRFDSFAGPELELFGYARDRLPQTLGTAVSDTVANALDRGRRWSRAIVIRTRPLRARLRLRTGRGTRDSAAS